MADIFRAATRAQRQLLWSLNYLLKVILWKYNIQSLKIADSVLWSPFMRVMADATFFTPPSPELSATLLSNKCWTLQSQRTRKCEITTIYRCTGRPFMAATRAQLQLFLVLFLLCFFFWFVKFVHVHFIWAPSRKNVFSGMVDLVYFKPVWSATKDS